MMSEGMAIVEEIAGFLRSSEDHVYRLIRARKLAPAYRDGKRFLVPWSAVREYLDTREIGKGI